MFHKVLESYSYFFIEGSTGDAERESMDALVSKEK